MAAKRYSSRTTFSSANTALQKRELYAEALEFAIPKISVPVASTMRFEILAVGIAQPQLFPVST